MAGAPVPDEQIRDLLARYLDPTSVAHLETNERKILQSVRRDAAKYPATIPTIRYFRDSLSYYSRARERYILKGRRRYNSFRKHVSFSPESILCGES